MGMWKEVSWWRCFIVKIGAILGQGTTLLNGKSVDEIIQACDKDGNGVIDYEEFKASLLSWLIVYICDRISMYIER